MNKRKSTAASVPRFAYDGLDRVIHERARLSVLTSLITHPKGLSFSELKGYCALTDGNLNRHLQVLEEAKLLTVAKRHDNNRPQTLCKITSLGRRRYLEYLEVLEQVILDGTRASSAPDSGSRRQVNS
jgi:DNA-binding MarR family transcriptional regulator